MTFLVTYFKKSEFNINLSLHNLIFILKHHLFFQRNIGSYESSHVSQEMLII